MGVRDTPNLSTKVSSAMRDPEANSPAKIISRKRSCALTDCEWVGSSSVSGFGLMRLNCMQNSSKKA